MPVTFGPPTPTFPRCYDGNGPWETQLAKLRAWVEKYTVPGKLGHPDLPLARAHLEKSTAIFARRKLGARKAAVTKALQPTAEILRRFEALEARVHDLEAVAAEALSALRRSRE